VVCSMHTPMSIDPAATSITICSVSRLARILVPRLPTYTYGPYGEPITSGGGSAWGGARYRYTGQIELPDAEVYFFKARVYDPAVGRFYQTDPAGYASDANIYAYVADDPINLTDPGGLGVSGTVTTDLGGGCVFTQFFVNTSQVSDSGNLLVSYTTYDSVTCVGGPGGVSPGIAGGPAPSAPPVQLIPPIQARRSPCFGARLQAAQLAKAFENASTAAGLISLGAGIGTAVSVAGEGITLGLDTPVTITFGSVSGFFGASGFGAGAAAAVLNSFARGDIASIRSFDFNQLSNLAAQAASSRIPFLKPYAELIGDLAEKGAGIAAASEEVCS